MKLLRNFELHDILFDLESGKEFKNSTIQRHLTI